MVKACAKNEDQEDSKVAMQIEVDSARKRGNRRRDGWMGVGRDMDYVKGTREKGIYL